MRIQPELVNIDYLAPGFVYRAHESISGVNALHLVDDLPGSIPSFDTRTGEEVSVPAS